MSEYTPTTEEVRNRYLSEVFPEDEAEFDRWLAQVKAQVWDEGHTRCFHVENPHNPVKGNPYREETK